MSQTLTLEALKSVLDYNRDTGIFKWKQSRYISQIGTVAGGVDLHTGYLKISIFNCLYRAHRLALFYVNGEFPRLDVDHINGIRTDNRLTNLREVTRSVNMQNQRRARSDNSTGFLGVIPKGNRFVAQIRTNGKTKCLGTYQTPEDAHVAYVTAKRSIHIGGTL